MRGPTGRALAGTPEPRALLLAGLRASRDETAARALRGVPAAAWEATLELATRHGVLPLLAQALLPVGGAIGVPDGIRTRLERGWRLSGVRNALVLAHVGEVLSRLAGAGVPVIALKGSDLLERVYADVGLRPMADVDLLVRPEHVGRAVDVVDALGFFPEDADGPHPARQVALSREHPHVAPMIRPGGIRVELHFALAADSDGGAIDHAGIWERAEQAGIGGASALVLSPEDLLLHLCVHLASHHGFAARLVQVCDIPAVVERWPDRIDWGLLRSRARAWGVERSVHAAMCLAQHLLRWTPPPEALAGHTAPSPGFEIAEACAHLLFEGSRIGKGSANFARLMGRGTTREKVGLAVARTFLSPREMAFRHGISPRSPGLLLRYPVRAVELLGRYVGRAGRVLRRDPAEIRRLEIEERRARLVAWLRAEGIPPRPPDIGPVSR